LRSRTDNCFQHRLAMAQNVGIPESKDAIALCVQPGLSHLIMVSFPIRGVLTAIKLDDESAFVAHEVDNVRADRNLATKTESIEAMGAELGPEDAFGVSHL
jgi:hypothetical protein